MTTCVMGPCAAGSSVHLRLASAGATPRSIDLPLSDLQQPPVIEVGPAMLSRVHCCLLIAAAMFSASQR